MKFVVCSLKYNFSYQIFEGGIICSSDEKCPVSLKKARLIAKLAKERFYKCKKEGQSVFSHKYPNILLEDINPFYKNVKIKIKKI